MKTNFKGHLNTIGFMCIFSFFLTGLYFYWTTIRSKDIAGILIFLVSINVLPSVTMYIQYLYISAKTNARIDFSARTIIVTTNHIEKHYSFDDLNKVTKTCSYPEAENRSKWLTTDSFFYFELLFKDHTSIRITSLSFDGRLNHLPNRVTRKRLFPFIY